VYAGSEDGAVHAYDGATGELAWTFDAAASETFRGVGPEQQGVYGSRIVSGLAVVLGGMAALFVGLSLAYNLVFLAVAVMFGLSAFFVWYHASGRFARRLYRGVENQARVDGVGAGPRDDWDPPRNGGTARTQAGRGRARAGGGRAGPTDGEHSTRRGPNRGAAPPESGPTRREAYAALDLDPDADQGAVRAAYRRKVKEVHPDRPSGDEEAFKEVKDAYERLTDG